MSFYKSGGRTKATGKKQKAEIKIECMKAEKDVRRRLGNKILDMQFMNSICMEEREPGSPGQ